MSSPFVRLAMKGVIDLLVQDGVFYARVNRGFYNEVLTCSDLDDPVVELLKSRHFSDEPKLESLYAKIVKDLIKESLIK